MTFSKKPPRRAAAGPVPAPDLPRPNLGPIVLLAVGALIFCLWAIERHCYFRPRQMLVPVPTPAPSYDPDAGETPVPELLR